MNDDQIEEQIEKFKKHRNKRILYKYKSLDRFDHFMDIVLNNRLYASTYLALNDPMEGQYYISTTENDVKTDLDEWREQFFDRKKEVRICSLSETSESTLMWSHYANSHTGVAIGVEVIPNSQEDKIVNVDYIDDIPQITMESTPHDVLSKKLKAWSYEKEARVLTKKEFVNVRVVEVAIGKRCSPVHRALIKKIASLAKQDILISETF